MEDQKADTSEQSEASSDKIANQSARAGARAKGGITAQPGDPTSPKQAAARSAERDEAMKEAGSAIARNRMWVATARGRPKRTSKSQSQSGLWRKLAVASTA